MNKKVTVIVPVYNVEKYIGDCIKSIITQTYKNIEIILVDDGSNDESGKICDLFAKDDYRIKVIHKANGGVSSARNVALDCCTGQYICFVDGDDYIERNTIESLISYVKNENYDCIQFGYNLVKKNTKISKWYTERMIINNQDEILNLYFRTSKVNEIIWNKFFKTDVFKKIRFLEGTNNEDYIIMPEILMSINKILIIEECFYNYMIRDNSIMNSKFSEKKMDRLVAGQKVIEFCEKNMQNHIINARINLCWICIYLCSELIDTEILDKNKYFILIKECYIRNFLLINKSKEFRGLNIIKRFFLDIAKIDLYRSCRIYRVYLKKKMGE